MGYGNGQTATAGRYDDSANMKTPQPPQRVPLVTELFTFTDKSVETLHDVISALENRLSHVLRSTGPEASGTEPVEGTGVPFGDQMYSLNTRLSSAYDRLNSILVRLEV